MKPGEVTEIVVVFKIPAESSEEFVNDHKRYNQERPREVREALWLRDQLRVVYEDGYLDGEFVIPLLQEGEQ